MQADWNEPPWVGGGYNSWPRPWTDNDPIEALRRPRKGVHFACAELAPGYRGFIEGALRSGLSVADRILTAAPQSLAGEHAMTALTRRATVGLLPPLPFPCPSSAGTRGKGGAETSTTGPTSLARRPSRISRPKPAIAVVYDTFTSTEESEAKLMIGGTGYDVVAIVGANLPYLNAAGLFAPLDGRNCRRGAILTCRCWPCWPTTTPATRTAFRSTGVRPAWPTQGPVCASCCRTPTMNSLDLVMNPRPPPKSCRNAV